MPNAASRATDDEVDAVLAACRLLVGISVRSISAVETRVTLVQLRVMTVVASHDGLTLSQLAEATGLHLSRASRTCDRLVASGLLKRGNPPDDRRSLRLTLSAAGRSVVARVAEARRAAIRPALAHLSADERARLVDVLTTFIEAGGEPTEAELWSLGWTTARETAQRTAGSRP